MTGRFERIQRGPLHLIRRDCEALQALFAARYLTNRMICRLLYRPTTFSWCKQRLRYLYDAGYVRKRRVQVNEPDIYYLGLRGRRYIASLGEYARPQVDRIAGVSGREAETPALMMGHDLTLSQLYVSAVLECRQRGWALEWENARMLELRRFGIQPDAYLRVTGERIDKRAFIEFTAVMPTREEMRGKLNGYAALEEAMNGVTILWFTTSKSKLEQLYQQVAAWEYADYVLLGLIEEEGEYLTQAMWRWGGSGQPVRFVTPGERTLYEGGDASSGGTA